ncbi:MAG: antibiotic biosynthesis monooxygenase [Bacteroidota bacterium]
MILEHVHIQLRPGERDAYLENFKVAKPLVRSQAGCISCELLPKLNAEHEFLLLIRWEKVSDHTEGFRQSAAYQQWSALLHPFYAEFPAVDYFVLPD